MKKFKKVLAAVLAMAMVLGMSVTSMAADVGEDKKMGTSDDRGTITVSGIDWSENITATAYKIIEAKYENDVFVGYEFVEGIDAGSMKLENDAHEPIDLIGDDLKLSEISKIAAYCKTNGTVAETVTTANDKGDAVFENLEVGTYLILIEGAELKIYNPIVASIYYTGTGTGNGLDEATFDITEDHAWTKIASAPNVDKVIAVGTDSNVKGNSENIGDIVKYQVTVSPIPNYGGEHPVFNIKDTLSTGLTYVEGSLSVLVGGKEFTDYESSASEGSKEIVVDFAKNNVYTLYKNVGETLVISYKARLNENAQVNQLGNKNDVVLTYSRNSAIKGDVATDSDVTYTHTFDIDGNVTGAKTTNIITKKDGIASDSNAKELPGAEFTLYTDKDTKTPYNRVLTEGRTEKGLVVSDAEGQLTITGLEEGTYYLKETKAPTGYSLNTHVFEIVIKDVVLNNDGTLKSWKISIDGADTASFTVNNDGEFIPVINGVVVPNTKLSSLPSTGGIGTTIFTLGGCAIMIIAAGLYFASRRKKNEE